MPCSTMRNGPVVETRQYLHPMQAKLVASELEIHSPPSSAQNKPDMIARLCAHLKTHDWPQALGHGGARSWWIAACLRTQRGRCWVAARPIVLRHRSGVDKMRQCRLARASGARKRVCPR
eukprot:7189298-Pyramimonas_sp.AAC.1